ncbi:MAG: hypothetical protein O3C28_09120 [Proteobacteria bacterium]|nr:hypothetical protein [Pseudomonadota bacterium]
MHRRHSGSTHWPWFAWSFSFAVLTFSFGALAESSISKDPVAVPANDQRRYLSFERRHEQMTFLIHPTMMEQFQAFYKTPSPELRCTSCHGENAEDAAYNLANSTLAALDPARVQALYRTGAVLTPEQTFKRDVATPTMARLMGVPPYDPSTGLGFSCFGCHRQEESK